MMIDINGLEQCSIEKRKELPAICCVYLVINDANRVFYIGMSKNLKNRWYIHERLKDAILAGATKISYIPQTTEVEARCKEKQLIRYFKPILNNEKLIDKRTHSDYTQSAAYLPKQLVKNFKQLALELEIGHSEAMEEAIRMWCDAAIAKVNQR